MCAATENGSMATLVVESARVLVALQPLEHRGHDELASEQRHEAGAGGVPT